MIFGFLIIIILAEYLHKLEDNDLCLNPANQDDHPPISKEEVVKCLHQIDLRELAEILSKNNGKSFYVSVGKVDYHNNCIWWLSEAVAENVIIVKR